MSRTSPGCTLQDPSVSLSRPLLCIHSLSNHIRTPFDSRGGSVTDCKKPWDPVPDNCTLVFVSILIFNSNLECKNMLYLYTCHYNFITETCLKLQRFCYSSITTVLQQNSYKQTLSIQINGTLTKWKGKWICFNHSLQN